MLECGLVHALTGVRDPNDHVRPDDRAGVLSGEVPVDLASLDPDGEASSVGHGVARVDSQIENRLFEPDRVHADETRVQSRLDGELDLFADEPPDH